MLIKVSKPFTEYVPNEGMVVGNMGDVVELPDNMAQNRIDAGFATTEGVLEARELAEGEMLEEGELPEGASASPVDAPVAKPRGKSGPKPKAPASPVDAPVA
jgi:hypothetical protein